MSMTPERWRVVKALFDEALEMPSEARSLWLSDATANDAGLRREVESLLEALGEERDRFERPALLRSDPPDRVPGPELPEVGTRVGPYRLVRQVGQGGMGVVFEAYRDDDHYRKRVAIKTISRGRDSDLILRRFRYERQILARLEHRNIAVLLDGGVTESGQPYFAMEYVEGIAIDQFADAQRLGIRERLQLFRQVCAAVQYAHQNLVIHRDLKPSNILVTADGTVKLLDFGIAKLIRPDDGSEGEGLTQPGITPLTTAYASPEQVRGEAVTTATDVFSLGLVLYKLLSGQHPFSRNLPSSDEVRRRIREDTPAPPSATVTAETAPTADPSEVRRLQRTLHGDLDSIVLMALRKEQLRRYPSVGHLGEDILRYLAGLPVAAQPDSLGYRTRKFVRRNRTGVMGGSAVVLALVGGLWTTAWQAQVAGRERDRARMEAAKATRVTRFMQEMFRSADPRVDGKDVTVAEALGLAARRAETDLAAEPEVQAAVLSSIGRTWLGLGRYDNASGLLTRALDMERRFDDGHRAGVTEGLRYLAALEAERGNIDKAEPLFREALERARRLPSDSAALGDILDGLGALEIDKGAFAAAEPILREALVIRRAVRGNRHEDVANSLNNLAVALGQQGRWAEAVPLHREALEVIRGVKGVEHPDVASAINVLANASTILGDYASADTLFQQALAQRVKLLGAHHPEVAWTHYSYADMLRLKGDYAGAIREAQAVLGERGGSLPNGHPMVHSALYVLGRSLLSQGHAERAEGPLRESARLRAAGYPNGHWLTASAEGALGECLLARHRYAEAEALLAGAYQVIVKARGEQDPRVMEIRKALAQLYLDTGRPREAAKYRG